MLVALTVERYLAVCRLGRTRAFAAKKTPLVAVGLALLAVSLYLPYLFRAHVITCSTVPDGLPVYRKRENPSFAHSTLWAAYLWTLEVIFKVTNEDLFCLSPTNVFRIVFYLCWCYCFRLSLITLSGLCVYFSAYVTNVRHVYMLTGHAVNDEEINQAILYTVNRGATMEKRNIYREAVPAIIYDNKRRMICLSPAGKLLVANSSCAINDTSRFFK